jgi:hypothetical protein
MKLRPLAFAIVAFTWVQLVAGAATAQTAAYGGHATYLDQGWSTDTPGWWRRTARTSEVVP